MNQRLFSSHFSSMHETWKSWICVLFNLNLVLTENVKILQRRIESKLERHGCVDPSNIPGVDCYWFEDLGFQVRTFHFNEITFLNVYYRIWRRICLTCVFIFVFSGDIDSVVPVTATRYSLAQLKLSTKVPWYPWYVKRQVSHLSSFFSCVL